MNKKPKVATFNRVMSLDEETSLGESLREADRLYRKRRSPG